MVEPSTHDYLYVQTLSVMWLIKSISLPGYGAVAGAADGNGAKTIGNVSKN